MALRHGDRGPEVAALQTDLATAGFDPGSVDGVFGRRTADAVRALQEAAGLVPDGVYGPHTAGALAARLDGDLTTPVRGPADTDADDPGSTAIDGDELLDHDEEEWVHTGNDIESPAVPGGFPDFFDNWGGEFASNARTPFYLHESSGRTLEWKGRPTPVDLSARTHVCMHITAVEFGTSAQQRRRWTERLDAGELSDELVARYAQGIDDDGIAERMALHERFGPVAYHWVALRNGDVLYNNPPQRYTYHGNRSNSFALGVAVEADLPGREVDRRDTHTTVDEHLVATGRAALRLAVTTGRELGAPLTHVTAHRCFSMTRAGDPGEAVWRRIVLPVCGELDLTVDHDLVIGGRHLPVDWDPDATHDWHDRPVGAD